MTGTRLDLTRSLLLTDLPGQPEGCSMIPRRTNRRFGFNRFNHKIDMCHACAQLMG
jgi:hypothetical protein